MTRFAVCVFALSASVFSTAQDYFGTKSDAVQVPSKAEPSMAAGPGWPQLIQLFVVVLAVILLLRWLLPKVAAKSIKSKFGRGGKRIRVEESTVVAGGGLHLICVDNRRLLVSSGQSGMNLIADLTPTGEEDEAPAFFEILDQASVETTPPKSPEDALAQLERLGQ